MAIFFIAFIPALISCSASDDDVEEEKPSDPRSEKPIGFCLDVFSRAVDLSTVYDNFCVRSFKVNTDGTKSLVIPNYLVKNIGGKWVYYGHTNVDGSAQFLKYWDLSADSYTFAAVTPAVSAGTTYTIDDDGMFTIDFEDLTNNLMVARTIRLGVNDATELIDYDDIAEDVEDIDKSAGKTSAVFPTPNMPYADVPLNFHSILAKIVIKAYADDETMLTPLEVGFNNIEVAPATYNSASGWTTTPLDYQLLYNQNTLITDEQNSQETALKLTELFVIPQQKTDEASNSLVQIKVKSNNDDDHVHNINLPCLWEPNNTYIYYLKFASGATGEVILFDVKVEPFTKGGEAENEQNNW